MLKNLLKRAAAMGMRPSPLQKKEISRRRDYPRASCDPQIVNLKYNKSLFCFAEELFLCLKIC
jgi:hypothetical protein